MICLRCRENKPDSDFARNKDMRSGHDSTCKKCRNFARKLAEINRYDRVVESHPEWTKPIALRARQRKGS